jgi:hypothetical protein
MHTTANSARRHRRKSFITAVGATAAALLFAQVAEAAVPEPSTAPDSSTAAPKAADPKAADPKKGGAPPSELREETLKRYYFLGVRFRDLVVPKFMFELFAKGGSTGNAWLIGPELSTRKNSTEIDISFSYADYGYGPAMLKGKNDPDIGYEVVKSDLKIGYLTFDLLYEPWRSESGMFSFLIGGGIGIGIVAGDLYRTQTYPANGKPDPNDPSKWKKCTGAGDGGALAAYCDNGNDHYFTNGKDYSEKSWLDGGSKPVVLPWISLPQLSFRFKPHKHFQARLDAGFSLSGFFFGLSAGYGF